MGGEVQAQDGEGGDVAGHLLRDRLGMGGEVQAQDGEGGDVTES